MCCGSHNDHGSDHPSKHSGTSIGITLLGISAVVGILIYAGQGPRLLSWLPLLVLLACPLMHVFMHADGHDHHAPEGGTNGPALPKAPAQGNDRRPSCH